MITVAEAIGRITSLSKELSAETVTLEHAAGRVLAEDITADRDYPPFDRATMDGFAVKSDDLLAHRSETYRIIGELFAGDGTLFTLRSGDALKIMTGAPVPASADAVIKKEDAEERGGVVNFRGADVHRYENIARRGEVCARGGLIQHKYVGIHAAQLSLLAAAGRTSVRVVSLPRIAILSTGNEVRPVSADVAPHEIRDANSWAIRGFLSNYAIEPVKSVIVRDSTDELTAAIESVIDADIIIISGGVSAGDADLVPGALAVCGVREVFHRVKIRPGKPFWFGCRNDGVRVFALPGNPFSVQTACRVFIDPYLRACLHLPDAPPLMLPLKEARAKRTPFDEFFPARLAVNVLTEVDPLRYHTSGDLTAATGADGIGLHPADAGDLAQGDAVALYAWNSRP